MFAAGWLLGVFLPSLLLKRRGERKRLEDLEDLTDCLRQLVARLPDQASFTRALEVQIAAQPGQRLTPVLIQVLEELRLGSGMTEAMELCRRPGLSVGPGGSRGQYRAGYGAGVEGPG